MKKTVNTLSAIVFYTLAFSGILRIIYFFMDLKESLKVNTDLPKEDYEERHTRTTYPDQPLDFNNWAKYIHEQLN